MYFIEKKNTVYKIVSIFAVLVIFLPIHPSVQSVLVDEGISSELISILLLTPVLLLGLVRFQFNRLHLPFIILILLYILWMLSRALFSHSVGQSNYIASIKSLLALIPLSVFCSMMAAKDTALSSKVIMVLGGVAFLHLVIKYAFFEHSDEGFKSLSSGDNHNYQATSYYIGLFGSFCSSLVICARKIYSTFICLLGFLLVLLAMGFVGTRSTIVALIIAFVLMLTLFARTGKITLVFGFLLSGVLIGLSLIDIGWLMSKLVVVDRFEVLLESNDSSSRIMLFSMAVEMLFDNSRNLLIGGGLGDYPNYIGKDGAGWYPHNFILESLAEGGVVALLIMLLIGYHIISIVCTKRKNTNSLIQIYVLNLLLFTLLTYQFIGGIQTLWIPIFFVSFFVFSNVEVKSW